MDRETVFIILLAVAIGAAAWSVVWMLIEAADPNRRKLKQRLQADWSALLKQTGGRSAVLKEPANLPGIFARSNYWQRYNIRLQQAFPETTLVQFLLVVVALAGLMLLIGAMLLNSMLLGSTLAIGVGSIPFMVVRIKRARRQKQLLEQLVDALDFLGRVLRAGHSLATAFSMMADELPEPIASDFRRCYDQHSLGKSLEEAMVETAARVDSPEFAFFVTSVIIQRQTGGDLAEILDNISATVRRRVRLGQHLKALTAEGRATGYLLTALPPICFGLVYLLNPEYAGKLIFTQIGQMCLLVTAVLLVIGLVWIKKVVTLQY